MVEKIFVQSVCISCAKETSVIFVIKDLNGELLFKIPLCRECSDNFAKDKINKLKGDNLQMKAKIKQMNIKSALHKKEIAKLHRAIELERYNTV